MEGVILLFGLIFTRLSLGARWNGISMPSAQGGELSVDQGGTKRVFSLSTLGWVYFVLSQWGEFEWSMRKETALVPCTQSHPRTICWDQGAMWLHLLVIWEAWGGVFLQLCTVLCALLNGAPLPRNKSALLGKNPKINQRFEIIYVAPTWYILS